ncbi:MAG TPA: DUF5678 domain-containing protein [Blastocatellia bacterium]
MTTTSMPEVRRIKEAAEFSQNLQWLQDHSREYVGKWIVLEDGRFIGAGDDPVPIVARARKEGVTAPFVEFIRDESAPFTGGWL